MTDKRTQRIKELDRERASLLASAKTEALARAKEAIADLNELGFQYQLVEAGALGKAAKGRGKAPRKTSDAPCPVCKFMTAPAHDGRRHRGQGKRKKPFTTAELKDLGLVRV